MFIRKYIHYGSFLSEVGETAQGADMGGYDDGAVWLLDANGVGGRANVIEVTCCTERGNMPTASGVRHSQCSVVEW